MWFDKICTQNLRFFKSSFTEDDNNIEIVSEERTSTYIHLTKSQDKVIRDVERRAGELVGVSSDFVEPLQIVSYTQNQYFTEHHDAGTLHEDSTVTMIQPRRLATLFIYLNTLPHGQGHTEFPLLNLSVRPEQGSGLLFCNILSDGTPDPLLVHKASSVSGDLRKFGINVS